jgi:hypothetical protein
MVLQLPAIPLLFAISRRGALDVCMLVKWYSTFFFRVFPDVIPLQLPTTPTAVGVLFKLYTVYNPHLK